MTKAEFDEFAKSSADIAGENPSFFGLDFGYFGRHRSGCDPSQQSLAVARCASIKNSLFFCVGNLLGKGLK